MNEPSILDLAAACMLKQAATGKAYKPPAGLIPSGEIDYEQLRRAVEARTARLRRMGNSPSRASGVRNPASRAMAPSALPQMPNPLETKDERAFCPGGLGRDVEIMRSPAKDQMAPQQAPQDFFREVEREEQRRK